MSANPNRRRISCEYCGAKRTITRAPNASLTTAQTLCKTCRTNGAPVIERTVKPKVVHRPAAPTTPPDRQTCWTHKVRYATEHEANQALGAYRLRKRKSWPRSRVYECNQCAGFHLTHLQNYRAKKIGAWV